MNGEMKPDLWEKFRKTRGNQNQRENVILDYGDYRRRVWKLSGIKEW